MTELASPWWLTIKPPGGFIESCASTDIRPRYGRTQADLPRRGRFTFPEPYNTTGIRLTNEDDGPILPCGYSYWANINSHANEPYLFVFLGTDRNRGGAGPSLWSVSKATDEVTPLGPIFPADHPLSWATGEGWYWSATEPYTLFVSDLFHLWRLDVRTKALTAVIDIAGNPFNKYIWQLHSSADGRTHSATVKDLTTYAAVGAVVFREASAPTKPWLADPSYYPARGDFDECQISPDGAWLLIKSNVDGLYGEDNWIVNVDDGRSRLILDQAGAAGHSDCGFGYMVAADNWNPVPNAIRVWMLDEAQEPQGRIVYHGANWNADLNHISHGNARPGPPEEQYVVGSGASRNLQPRNNEVVAFPLDGSLRALVIAPTMVDLDAPGGGDDYSKLPKGNLDPTGGYFLWTSNHGSDRLDAFLVKVPGHLL